MKIALFDQPTDKGLFFDNKSKKCSLKLSGWLPDRDSKRTNSKVVSEEIPYFYKYQNKTKTLFREPKPDNLPKNKIITQKEQRHIDYVESYENPIEKALELEEMMREENLTQSGLAEKLGISRVRVSQYLSLLKLPQEKIDYILKKGKDEIIIERQLRSNFNSNSKPYTLFLKNSAQDLTKA